MGDTPVKFGFLDSGDDILPPVLNQLVGGNSAFSVKPRCGLLRKNESQLMVFRFSPQEAKVYDRGLKCIFNSNMSNSYVSLLLLLYFVKPMSEKLTIFFLFFKMLTASSNARCWLRSPDYF